MTGTILDKIYSDKRIRVEAARRATDPVALRGLALQTRSSRGSHRLREALSDRSRINIIAEFKKASPSKGVINDEVDPADIARQYESAGAGSDAILLIAAMLEDDDIEKLRAVAEDQLCLDALIEVHTLDELER